MDLKGPPPPESIQNPDLDTDPKNIIKGSGEFFPFQASNPKVFPFPIFFRCQPKAEWNKPASNKQYPTSVRCLYNLPNSTNDFLAVPLVDATVLALQSSGLLAEDGQGSIRDAWDKRIEITLRHSHEVTALVIKECATASIATRASIV